MNVRPRERVRERPERLLSATRELIAAAIGVFAGGLVALAGQPELSVMAGWIVATIVALVGVWWVIWPQDHVGTERLAEQESRSRSTDTAVLTAALLSLVAVVVALVRSSSGQSPATTAAVVLSVVAVVLSWALVNTVFALKYARLYYVEEDRNIELDHGAPAYSDFAFIAFGMGMSYAPPEIKFDSPKFRKVGLGHGLLSYVFGTGVLAVAVNLVTNLAQS